jgi:hypothetical protein
LWCFIHRDADEDLSPFVITLILSAVGTQLWCIVCLKVEPTLTRIALTVGLFLLLLSLLWPAN